MAITMSLFTCFPYYSSFQLVLGTAKNIYIQPTLLLMSYLIYNF